MDNKTSVKVHNPPGGQSSFTIGQGYVEPVPQNKKTTNQVNRETPNQNVDPTLAHVKVAQRPGGNSTFQIGGGYEDNQNQNKAHTSVKIHQQPQSNIFNTDIEQPKNPQRPQHPQQTSNIFGGYEEKPKPVVASRTNQNQSHNNIFGGGQDEPPKKTQQQQQQANQAQEPQKTSVKVHNPPGGRSNFTLG